MSCCQTFIANRIATKTAMNLYRNFASLLSDVRKQAGLTHVDLASAIGVSHVRYISRWENGYRPNDEHFEALARTLEIPAICAGLALQEFHSIMMFTPDGCPSRTNAQHLT